MPGVIDSAGIRYICMDAGLCSQVEIYLNLMLFAWKDGWGFFPRKFFKKCIFWQFLSVNVNYFQNPNLKKS